MTCCSVFAPEQAVAMIMRVMQLTVITLTRLSYNVGIAHVNRHTVCAIFARVSCC